MELTTISQVSRRFDVTTRALRYYEEIGLLSSTRTDGYAYRVYDEEAVQRLQHILILRKLDISLRDIQSILMHDDAAIAIDVFCRQIQEMNARIDALSTLRSILWDLTLRLQQVSKIDIHTSILGDARLMDMIQSLAPVSTTLKETNNMDQMNQASDKVNEIKDVRILYLPPATVASTHHVGPEPEAVAAKLITEFIKESGLCDIKPDLRVYGFNNPNPDETGRHGYEFWVTIPDDMDVAAPAQKKTYEGGLYAAHCIKMGNFHEWQWFVQWLENSEEYEYEQRPPEGMHGSLEEHLNAYSYYQADDPDPQSIQLDLLIPIKRK